MSLQPEQYERLGRRVAQVWRDAYTEELLDMEDADFEDGHEIDPDISGADLVDMVREEFAQMNADPCAFDHI